MEVNEDKDLDAIVLVCGPTYNRNEWLEMNEGYEVELSPCPRCGDTHPLMFVDTHYRIMCPKCGWGHDHCWRTNEVKAVMDWEEKR